MTQASASMERSRVRAVLAESGDESVMLAVLGTDYRVRLAVYQRPSSAVGKRIAGTIHAKARRVDVVWSGGRYVEPVFGRPRRIQGVVAGVDSGANTITVDAGVPFVCKVTDPRQRAEQFSAGQMVALDLLPGASFTPAGA